MDVGGGKGFNIWERKELKKPSPKQGHFLDRKVKAFGICISQI